MPVRGLTVIALVAAMAFVGQAQAADPVFHGSVSILTKAQKEEMRGKSWHKGCPVLLRDLRLATVDFWGFGGALRQGRIVIHERQAWKIKRVFGKLFYAEFRIRRMVPIDKYGASDDRSMDANNTSGTRTCPAATFPRRPGPRIGTARNTRSGWSTAATRSSGRSPR